MFRPGTSLREKPGAPGSGSFGRVFLIMALVVILSTAITYWAGLRVIRMRSRVAFNQDVIERTDQLLSTMKDAESGQRGFIITGDERYLQPYDKARARLPVDIDRFSILDDVTAPSGTLRAIQDLVSTKLDEMDQAISLRRSKGFEAASALVREGIGKQTMDQLRLQVDAVHKRTGALIQDEQSQIISATRLRTGVFAAGGLVDLLFIAWAYNRIRLAMEQRGIALAEAHKKGEELAAQKDLLKATLSSIGDCVIVTDADANITFMNVIAEMLTGWTFDEIKGRPVETVFRIINEQTRAAVQSPVVKVLTEGIIVGLANHTLLVRKDGSEVPIDDSGAPIYDAEGNIRGVILVFRDFSSYKKAENVLREAKATAETANAAKDHFLAMLSHELRTPLTPVLATLNLWEASEDVPAAMKSDVQMLRRSVELEARIIDDLLDLTRIAKGMLTFTMEAVDVHETIQFLVDMCHTEFQGKRLNLSVKLDAQQPFVRPDAGRLQQILWNVIKNAAKFTSAGGEVRIATHNDDAENIVITVVDTGIGMPEETMSRLFKPFEQGDKAISRRLGGLGLGLAISSQLARQLGGRVIAASEGLGKGSTFTITFPNTDEVPSSPGNRETEGAESAAGTRFLLVEDHTETALALTRLLVKHGYVVQTVGTVASALEAVAAETFDLIICDIGLPDGTGFELLEKVRKTTSTPAIALSGFGMEEDVAQSKLSGFDRHLTKPVNLQNLEAAIRTLVADARAEPAST